MNQFNDTGGEHAHKLTSELKFPHRGKGARGTTLLLLLVSLYCLAGPAFAGSGTRLDCEIRGEFKKFRFNQEGAIRTESKYRFNVWLREREWLIRLVSAFTNITTASYEYEEFGTYDIWVKEKVEGRITAVIAPCGITEFIPGSQMDQSNKPNASW